jgi:ribose-phosphate pyrophosphokinase
MCSTGGTLVSAAKVCQEKGAKNIFATVTHGLFVGDSIPKLEEGPIQELFMSNTIPETNRLAGTGKIRQVSVAPIFARGIRCIIKQESISSMNNLETCPA